MGACFLEKYDQLTMTGKNLLILRRVVDQSSQLNSVVKTWWMSSEIAPKLTFQGGGGHNLKKVNFIVTAFITVFVSLSAFSKTNNWAVDKKNNRIYTVFKTIDSASWNVTVVLEVRPKEINVVSLVPFKDYTKYFTHKYPTYLSLDGIDLVKHTSFFSGKKGGSTSITIDSEKIPGFIKSSEYQVTYQEKAIDQIISKMKKGNSVKLNQHYYPKGGDKAFPTFSLIGFSAAYMQLNNGATLDKSLAKTFPVSGLKCKSNGPRKSVWINTKHGSYALNGPAISWVQKSAKMGVPLTGSDRKRNETGT